MIVRAMDDQVQQQMLCAHVGNLDSAYLAPDQRVGKARIVGDIGVAAAAVEGAVVQFDGHFIDRAPQRRQLMLDLEILNHVADFIDIGDDVARQQQVPALDGAVLRDEQINVAQRAQPGVGIGVEGEIGALQRDGGNAVRGKALHRLHQRALGADAAEAGSAIGIGGGIAQRRRYWPLRALVAQPRMDQRQDAVLAGDFAQRAPIVATHRRQRRRIGRAQRGDQVDRQTAQIVARHAHATIPPTSAQLPRATMRPSLIRIT